MRICLVCPVVSLGPPITPKALDHFMQYASSDTIINTVFLDSGPVSVESEYDVVFAGPGVVKKITEAEKEGYDVAIVNCMADPGVKAAQEKVSIPVIGAAMASIHIAAMLGQRFSIVTVVPNITTCMSNIVSSYRLNDKLASIRNVGIPVDEIEKDHERVVKKLTEQSIASVTSDGAHAILLGCTGMTGLSEQISSRLVAEGINVPVIDPGLAALKVAELIVTLKLSHSKITYVEPLEKLILGY